MKKKQKDWKEIPAEPEKERNPAEEKPAEEKPAEEKPAEEKPEKADALADEVSAGKKEPVETDPREDVTLFRSLFPQVKAEEIPEAVWSRVEQGESLSAAYALYEKMEAAERERIGKINRDNAEKAPPKIHHDGAESDYFSPEAVKAMSRSEIKKHYDAILRSMEKWN